MKILVVGGGGREHAIIKKCAESSKRLELYCAPGNGGIHELATCVDMQAMELDKITAFAKKEDMDLVIVAPDDPLAAGLVDMLEQAGIPAFGPNRRAAQLESSKAFAKGFMEKHQIPTADYAVFDQYEKAVEYCKRAEYPIVLKADGLALGKGVIIAKDRAQALDALHKMMIKRSFGAAGSRVVIEEFLEGPEVSVLAFTDGKTILPMIGSTDHKRALDHDRGLNTGGMGAYAPSPLYDDVTAALCNEKIILPTLAGLQSDQIVYKGILYFGLIFTKQGPKLLEYNARFGDPEAQVVLPLLKNDLIECIEAVEEERLSQIKLEWEDKACVCVVMASGGYPVSYQKGYEIFGLDEANDIEDVFVYHAGTRKVSNTIVTDGGRVLGVTAKGDNLSSAAALAYRALEKIRFTDKHYRTDIGTKIS